jgi:hypothetical protein
MTKIKVLGTSSRIITKASILKMVQQVSINDFKDTSKRKVKKRKPSHLKSHK